MSDEKVYAQVSMEDGAIYRGCVEEGDPSGWSAMTFPDGQGFVGYFGLGEPAKGKCVELLPDKRFRVGLTSSHGGQEFSVELSPDGMICAGESGDWTKNPPLRGPDSVLNGDGVMLFPDGRIYVGTIKDGKAGEGRLPLPVPVEGEVAFGMLGRHFITGHNRGPFRYGTNPHGGDGVMLFPDGHVYVGEFTDGKPDGYGSID